MFWEWTVALELTTCTHLDDPGDRLWGLYLRAFEELRSAAVQRHLMNEGEFRAVLADERILKLVVTDDEGRTGGMATMTNVLHAVPLIAPEYFERKYPVLYAQNRVWYVSFVAVDPDHQSAGAMARLIGRMLEELGGRSGLICVDICRYRETASRLSEVIERQANRVMPGIKRIDLDAQVYWGYEYSA
jgi:ribosomal protein S18 acetylase RimI-like enzyme